MYLTYCAAGAGVGAGADSGGVVVEGVMMVVAMDHSLMVPSNDEERSNNKSLPSPSPP